MEEKKYLLCRYALPSLFDEKCFCKKTQTEIKSSECEICKDFKSRYIEFPINVSSIENDFALQSDGLGAYEAGKLAMIRPCSKKYENKSFLGISLGELPMGVNISYTEENQTLRVRGIPNPAFFVFEINEIIFGAESFWTYVEKEDDIRNITDSDISQQWYVKMLKQLSQKAQEECKESEEK